MRRLILATAVAGGLGAACLEDPELDAQLFPCRSQDDCVEGFTCAPERFVCVPEGDAPAADAGVTDGGAEE